MHYHCEIVLPPTDDINAAVESVMKLFYEGGTEEDIRSPFWDFWAIGGRWAGTKLMARYDQAKLDQFQQWMQDEKVTVSGLQCGKQELSPASQIPKVDKKWNELFPHESGEPKPCPMFRHANDPYSQTVEEALDGDICTLAEVNGLSCSRVIFAGPGWSPETEKRTGPLEAAFMLCDSQWNGVNHMPVKWDGTLKDALDQFRDELEHYAAGYREQMTPQDDWLVVTVDYHS